MLSGPARGVGRARLRPLDGTGEEVAEPVELPDPPEPAAEAPGVEPTARGVGPARLRLLPGSVEDEPAEEPADGGPAEAGAAEADGSRLTAPAAD
jgi:hypothetical protein